MYISLGRPHTHHQELNNCSSSLWFYRPDNDQQHCYHHATKVKPEAATAVVVAPDDGREDARNMLSCK